MYLLHCVGIIFHPCSRPLASTKDLDLSLGIVDADLQTMNCHNVRECKRKVIQKWMSTPRLQPSWVSLANALRQINVNNAAASITEKEWLLPASHHTSYELERQLTHSWLERPGAREELYGYQSMFFLSFFALFSLVVGHSFMPMLAREPKTRQCRGTMRMPSITAPGFDNDPRRRTSERMRYLSRVPYLYGELYELSVISRTESATWYVNCDDQSVANFFI